MSPLTSEFAAKFLLFHFMSYKSCKKSQSCEGSCERYDLCLFGQSNKWNLPTCLKAETIVDTADKAPSNPFDVSNTSGLIFVLDGSAKAEFLEL